MTLAFILRRWLLGSWALLSGLSAYAQAPTLLDDFNRADNNTVGSGWVETETTPGTGAAIVGNQLRLSSGVLGKDFVARDVSARYSSTLTTNGNQLSWAFNMQQSRPNPLGFASNNYGVAFVLAGSLVN